MVWTAPKTWASGYVVLAADLNLHLRDNLLMTAPAVMTTVGDIIYASGANEPARLAKSTTATQYLANTGTSYVPAWNEVALATGVSGTLPVANGGTGATSLTDKAVLISQDSDTDTVGSVALTTSGQIIIGGASGPAAATLTGGTNVTVTNGDGAIEIAASGEAATKEFYIPYVAADRPGLLGASDEYPVALVGNANDEAWISFFVPNDYSSITNAVLVLIGVDGGTWTYDTFVRFAANGQDKDENNDSTTSQTGSQLADTFFELDLEDILAGLAAGDYVGVRFLNPGGGLSANLLGLRFRYS